MELTREELKAIIREIIQEDLPVGHTPLGDRWRGGKLILEPAGQGTNIKELPIDAFFHKIVMLVTVCGFWSRISTLTRNWTMRIKSTCSSILPKSTEP